jgi:hypothetical protein
MRHEIWKPVIGYEGLYEVSNNGRIRSISGCNTECPCCGRKISRRIKGKILAFTVGEKGYLTVVLSKQGVSKRVKVHRIVAINFIPNPKNKPQVNHEDGIKSNNFVENLSWATNKENMEHAIRTGLSKGATKINI